MHLRTAPAEIPPHDTDLVSPFCPKFQFAIELIGRRWLGAIVRVLVSGPARFNEILAAIPGLSDRLLTERLRDLEQAGLVARTVSPTRPVRVTYELTCQGKTLDTVIDAISHWAERWVELPNECGPAGPAENTEQAG